MAWYYHGDGDSYYWTESYTLSVTEFASKISDKIGRSVYASDISQAMSQKEIDKMKRRATKLFYIKR